MSVAVAGIAKSFGAMQALRGIDLTVEEGQFVTLLGPSGCGKTTLLRIIAGLELADTGTVRLKGRDVTHLPANKRPVNTVFQSYALFPHLTVFENVAFGLRARGVKSVEVESRVKAALDLVRMGEYTRREPHQLSGGQQQRVALARALVNEPEVLLLDEPMSALDAKLREQVGVELRQLQRRLGTTFIMVTHDQDEALTVSDRIAVMHGGEIVQFGTAREVYERPKNQFVAEFLGTTNLIRGRRNGVGIITDHGVLKVDEYPAWEEGLLAIRPESIRLWDSMPSHNGLRARVRDSIYQGDHQEVWLEPATELSAATNSPLRMKTGAHRFLPPGGEVFLELPSEGLVPLYD
jgi:spermidine/putrescine transport system ATP-binding protein